MPESEPDSRSGHRMSLSQGRATGSLILLALLSMTYILVARCLPAQVSSFNLTHWLFSYQDGFHSRALVGTLMYAVFGDSRGSGTLIVACSGAITAVLAVALVLVGMRFWRSKRDESTLLEVAVLISCPGTMQYLAAESGRLDQVGYLVLLGGLVVLQHIRRNMQWFVVGVTSIVLCLIHEALVVMLGPILLAAVLVNRVRDAHDRRELLRWAARGTLALLPALATAAMLVTLGRLDYDTQLVEVVRRLSEVADFTISPTATLTQFRSVSQNALYTHSFWLELSRIPALATTAMALIPSGIVALRVVLHSLPPESSARSPWRLSPLAWATLVCCLAPIALILQGTDVARWSAAAVLNLFILGMVVAPHHAGNTTRPSNTVACPSHAFLWCVVAYSLAIGPLSVVAGPYSLMRLSETVRVLTGGI